ncbi:uncharacterized protein TRIREDRAFT_112682 [Trichoderma reesei QM6a]|uniref:Predicted protein n=1 Tax=Hypocrea jecorina (strain QM6a) TaxID=431241 RepID=G0RXP7_HYPJQ|nr:uncharacterized protein TRIREDRAFT_112682 [Trichoderma reesei QM6a]EGR44046.1 predicted protein [Trichoderma reesei QM6a]
MPYYNKRKIKAFIYLSKKGLSIKKHACGNRRSSSRDSSRDSSRGIVETKN